MAVSFDVPTSKPRNQLIYTNFLGADFTNDPSNMSPYFSPDCVNVTRDVPGKIRKRTGYKRVIDFSDSGWFPRKVKNIYKSTLKSYQLVQRGGEGQDYTFNRTDNGNEMPFKKLANTTEIDVVSPKSKGIVVGSENGIPIIMFFNQTTNKADFFKWYDDRLLLADNQSAKNTCAYYPIVSISCDPETGYGTSYEAVNMLTDRVIIQYKYDGIGGSTTSLAYLSNIYTPVRSSTGIVEYEEFYLNNVGEWKKFTWNGSTTTIDNVVYMIINTPSDIAKVTGEDNIRIVMKVSSNGASDICKCNVNYPYKPNSVQVTTCFSGNEDYKGRVWYSSVGFSGWGGAYVPETNYISISNEQSDVKGLVQSGSYLYAFLGTRDSENVIALQGTTFNDEFTFKIENTFSAPMIINNDACCMFNGEPVFLTDQGVYAITTQDIVGKEIVGSRSKYIDGKLTKESKIRNATLFVHDNFLYINTVNSLYLLDGMQTISSDVNAPNSSKQYAGFYFTGVRYLGYADNPELIHPSGESYEFVNICNVFENSNDELSLISEFGTIYKMPNDIETPENYADEYLAIGGSIPVGHYSGLQKAPVEAKWETPDLEGNTFYKNKTFRYIAIRLRAFAHTSVKVLVEKRGLWNYLFENKSKANYLSFQEIIFSRFSFSNDKTARVVPFKTRVKKVDKARFRLSNDRIYEPFALVELGFEYVENGNAK